MVKQGRFYIMLDVHWYDEWGWRVSNDAALLWVLALGYAKGLGSSTLDLKQLRRAAPTGMTDEIYAEAIQELIGCESAPISGDGRAIVLHGFNEWNSTSSESKSGVLGNHIRWHVNAGKPDPTCEHCQYRPESPPDIAPRSLTEQSNTIHKNLCASEPNPLESDFEECWEEYPRKNTKKESLAFYIARRREGIPKDTLLLATKHFADEMRKEGRDKTKILLGKTFFGPNERWLDYVEAPPLGYDDLPAPPPHQAFDISEYEDKEVLKLPGEQ